VECNQWKALAISKMDECNKLRDDHKKLETDYCELFTKLSEARKLIMELKTAESSQVLGVIDQFPDGTNDNKNEESTPASNDKVGNVLDGSSRLAVNDMVGDALDGELEAHPWSLLPGAGVDLSGLKAKVSPQLPFVLKEVAEFFQAPVACGTANALGQGTWVEIMFLV
jgi:hypothetical protein